jgi:hypothetical protein
LVLFRYFKSTNLEKPKQDWGPKKKREIPYRRIIAKQSPSFVAPLEDTSRPRFRLERAALALEYASNWTSAESDLQSVANLVIEQNLGKSAY